MTRAEAREILLLHRPGTADVEESQLAEALALAGRDPELKRWLAQHAMQQSVLREKLRAIAAPAGLKEQILSEQVAQEKRVFWRQNSRVAINLAATAVVLLLLGLVAVWLQPRNHENDFAIYQGRMVSMALRGYSMDLVTNDASQIRTWLSQNHAPADYVLPASLEKTDVSGCAVQSWQGVKVSMICFRTGGPLAPGAQSDLWLFVIDQASVKDAPAFAEPQFMKVNRLITATWTEGGKLYVLGTEGDEQFIRKFL